MHTVSTAMEGDIRQSNMELLRLLSMFFVLVIHANTVFDPWPIDHAAVQENPIICAIRFLIESLSIVCVNSFILLSGWFGIKFSIKRLLSFVFTVLFFSLVLTLLPSTQSKGVSLFIDIFTLNQYWFVKAYVILFILSPALNLFAEQAPRTIFKNVLITFFIMQTIFSYLMNSRWFDDGFSPIPFIGLYLLARYIRIYKPSFSSLNKSVDLCVYLGISLLLSILSICLFYRFDTGGRLFNYTNPLVIVSSVSFVLIFSKIKMRNNTILNWFAISSFGAYLLHMNPLYFTPYYINTLESFSSIPSPFIIIILTLLFILATFCLGVLIDKLRILLWRFIVKVIHLE